MTTDAATLAAFLLDRVAEDEEIARGGLSEPHYRGHGPTAADEVVSLAEGEGAFGGGVDFANHNNPTRVLAQCAATRAILAIHRPSSVSPGSHWLPFCEGCWEEGGEDGAPSYPCRTALAIVQPFADHPEFDPAWAT